MIWRNSQKPPIFMDQSDLDYALLKLNKTDITHPLSIADIFGSDSKLSQFEQIICCEKLRQEGFCKRRFSTSINKEILKREKDISNPKFYITYDGWRLMNRDFKDSQQPYTDEMNRRRDSHIKETLIKLAPIIIAIIAILFTYRQYKLANESFQESIKSKDMEKRIIAKDSAQQIMIAELDSLTKIARYFMADTVGHFSDCLGIHISTCRNPCIW